MRSSCMVFCCLASIVTVDKNTEYTRENGIDFMGIVSLILTIEEVLNIELDGVLAELRMCKNVSDLVAVINELYEED